MCAGACTLVRVLVDASRRARAYTQRHRQTLAPQPPPPPLYYCRRHQHHQSYANCNWKTNAATALRRSHGQGQSTFDKEYRIAFHLSDIRLWTLWPPAMVSGQLVDPLTIVQNMYSIIFHVDRERFLRRPTGTTHNSINPWWGRGGKMTSKIQREIKKNKFKLTACASSVETCRWVVMSHLLPSNIRSTSEFACYM